MTFDETYQFLIDSGYNLEADICVDNNQMIYYRMRKDDCRIQRMIPTTSIMELQPDIIFEVLKQELHSMARELDQLVFRRRNVYQRKVIIEKVTSEYKTI